MDLSGAKAQIGYYQARIAELEAEVERLKAAVEEAMWQIRGPVDDRKAWIALYRGYYGKPAENYENPNAGVNPSGEPSPHANVCGACGADLTDYLTAASAHVCARKERDDG